MAPLRVLIVEDDRDFAESLEELLVTRGYQVELAYTGEEGVRVYSENPFDITFMDMMLPDLGGVNSFGEIRALDPHARVVLMTGYSIRELERQPAVDNAYGMLNKPLDIDKVFALLERLE